MSTRWPRRLLPTIALAGAIAMSSCTTGASSSDSDAAQGSKALPDSIAESGVIRVGTYASYPPMTFKDPQTGEYTGSDIELIKAVAEKLGVTVQIHNVKFEGLITGLQSDRFDVAIGAISDTPDRRQQVDFVDYAKAFSGILVQDGNPEDIYSFDDLCGHPVATVVGSSQVDQLEQQSRKCQQQGKAPIDISTVTDTAQVELEVRGGRSVAQVRDYLLAAYRAENAEGELEVVTRDGEPVSVSANDPLGIALNKEDTELRDAILAAVEELMEDGTYDDIMTKWDAEVAMISDAAINEQ